MNNFKFLENINDNLYKCIRDLEKNISNMDFNFCMLAKSTLSIVLENYFDASFLEFIDLLEENDFEEIQIMINKYHNDFVQNNDGRVLQLNDFAVVFKKLSSLTKSDAFDLRSEFLVSLYFLFKNLPNFNLDSFVLKEYVQQEGPKLFNDIEIENDWKRCFFNADGRSLKNKLSYFFSTYILNNDESDYQSNILVEDPKNFGPIFYNESININEYDLFFILDPSINDTSTKNVIKLALEEIRNRDNGDLQEFISNNIDDQNNKVIFKFVIRELVDESDVQYIYYKNKKIDVKWYEFSNLSPFLQEADEYSNKKIQEARLTVKNSAHVNIPGTRFNTHFIVVDGESIRTLYLQAKEQNISLFDKNVREYIKDLKVDRGIQETIEKSAHNFLIYNNGLTIITNKIIDKGNEVFFNKMFIVNGGQTTSILGETDPSISLRDVSVFCKVIEFDFEGEEDEEFIENISINSNNQKQIKSIDYISTYSGLKKFEKYFNTIDPQGIVLLIKRSHKSTSMYKKNKTIVLDTTKMLQMLYSAIFKVPATAKQTPAVLLKNFEVVKKLFDELDLSKNNNIRFMSDLVYIYKILYKIVNGKTPYADWENNYRSKAAPHCFYFWIYLIVNFVAFDNANININELNSFIINKDENLLDYIKGILEISLAKIEEMHLSGDALSYNTILKTKTHLHKVEVAIKNDDEFKRMLSKRAIYFKGE
jgi:hypothetical protein